MLHKLYKTTRYYLPDVQYYTVIFKEKSKFHLLNNDSGIIS